jgi:hypothetical protein
LKNVNSEETLAEIAEIATQKQNEEDWNRTEKKDLTNQAEDNLLDQAENSLLSQVEHNSLSQADEDYWRGFMHDWND